MLIGAIIVGVSALLVGALVWFVSRQHVSALNARIRQMETEAAAAQERLDKERTRNSELNADIARLEVSLEKEKKDAAEKIALLEDAETKLSDAFKALSSDALKSNNQAFLELAGATLARFQTEAKGDLDQRKTAVESLVTPIRESLEKVSTQVTELEKARKEAYGGLSEQVRSLISTQEKLNTETNNLVRALRTPTVRGRWGEIQLRRVVEIADMLPYCDFEEQASVATESGLLRPDLVINLPGGKKIVVDAKAPLQAYLEALETEGDDLKRAKLADHGRQIRTHITKLSSKAYWEQFDSSPEIVVMFLPGESFFSSALEHDPGLIEYGVENRVLLATPISLIGLLRAVAYGWRQERIAESAQEISALGRELYGRICVMAEHFEDVRRNLDRSIEAYNKAIGSLERMVLSSARRFTDLGVGTRRELPVLEPVEKVTREIQAPELRPESDEDENLGH